ncbi:MULTISPECIES: MBL fold metallo-hydrolase [Olivibacter]|uniref:MBL fold metallo-hydrolase n=1 Tax=Olivibacter jilunii TaxID=985016 RepID=A0ABW6B576_9SPHI|nr:MBL fold metallo-hydrolase [Olivibacter sp. UJ_SKK_5.1]MDX3915726.1 MBL fold metallo-hydrolase [Pseudosphingobacterium sp.]
MNLTFWGAAQQVTGSMHLLEIEGYKILIDCGLNYEPSVSLEDNEHFPFHPSEIDVLILTHAHIDHSGNIPTLIRSGFQGQILSTSPTAALSELLMLDSVNIFLKQEKRKVKRGKKTFTRYNKPLYLQKHVMDAVERFVTIPFHKPFRITGNITLTLIPVGHLLGAAAAILEIEENGQTKKIAFSGDLGRKNYPILPDPQPLPPVDYLVCESTYGGRYHTDQDFTEVLINTIKETCIKTPGKLIIPAFSVGRTQALVYSLNRIFSEGLLPPVQIFVDSPLANYATEVYRKYYHLLNEEAQRFYAREGDQFSFENLKYVENLDESKDISNYYDPCIIVSSAGMLEGGRIQDHLYENIQNFYCTILFIGYCAKGTLGHRLLRGDSIVKIRSRELSVFASIKQTDCLSGHADHHDLVNTISAHDNQSLKKIFLVHGDLSSMQALEADLVGKGYQVEIPSKGDSFAL